MAAFKMPGTAPAFLAPPSLVEPTGGEVDPGDFVVEWELGAAEASDPTLTTQVAIGSPAVSPFDHIVYAATGVTRVAIPAPPDGVEAEAIYGQYANGYVVVGERDDRLPDPYTFRMA